MLLLLGASRGLHAWLMDQAFLDELAKDTEALKAQGLFKEESG